MTKKSIAAASTGVIAGYEAKIKRRVQRPIPVENIIELYNVKSVFCGPVYFDPCAENWPKIAGVVKEAGGFSNVSKQAMIIRLQDLGLVQNETRARLSWAESYSFFLLSAKPNKMAEDRTIPESFLQLLKDRLPQTVHGKPF